MLAEGAPTTKTRGGVRVARSVVQHFNLQNYRGRGGENPPRGALAAAASAASSSASAMDNCNSITVGGHSQLTLAAAQIVANICDDLFEGFQSAKLPRSIYFTGEENPPRGALAAAASAASSSASAMDNCNSITVGGHSQLTLAAAQIVANSQRHH